MPATPQSKVLAKFFEEIGEKCGEILAKFFADFRPSISREMAAKNFTKNPRHFPQCTKLSFFHCCNSGALGAQGAPEKFEKEKLVFNSHPLKEKKDRDKTGYPNIRGSRIKRKAANRLVQHGREWLPLSNLSASFLTISIAAI